MGGEAGALREALHRLNEYLVDARKRMSAEAMARREEIEEAGRRATEAGETIGKLVEAAAGLPEDEKLELMREAAAARSELAVVARLAAGSARFASLARGVGGAAPGGLYGPGGAAGGGAPRSVERRA